MRADELLISADPGVGSAAGLWRSRTQIIQLDATSCGRSSNQVDEQIDSSLRARRGQASIT
jgi:hypothetical protein